MILMYHQIYRTNIQSKCLQLSARIILKYLLLSLLQRGMGEKNGGRGGRLGFGCPAGNYEPGTRNQFVLTTATNFTNFCALANRCRRSLLR